MLIFGKQITIKAIAFSGLFQSVSWEITDRLGFVNGRKELDSVSISQCQFGEGNMFGETCLEIINIVPVLFGVSV